MGTGNVLLTLVVFGIAVMMMFSILPAMADHVIGKPAGTCPGAPNSPWELFEVNQGPSKDKDKNGNGHVCQNMKQRSVFIDDRIPR